MNIQKQTSSSPQKFKFKRGGFLLLCVLGSLGGYGFIYLAEKDFSFPWTKREENRSEALAQEQTRHLKAIEQTLTKIAETLEHLHAQQTSFMDKIDQRPLAPPFPEELSREKPLAPPSSGALKALEDKLLEGKPFSEEYGTLYDSLSPPSQRILKRLDVYKNIGIPQEIFLRKSFATLTTSLSSRQEKEGRDWKEKLLSLFKKMVIISKEPPEETEVSSGRMEEIQHQLELKNFSRALEMCQALPFSSAEKETWEYHMQAYIEAHQVLSLLKQTPSVHEEEK